MGSLKVMTSASRPLEDAGADAGIAAELDDGGGLVPGRLPVEPLGVGEVVQRDHRPDAGGLHPQQPLAVLVDGGLVHLAADGLDARPLQGDAERSAAHFLGELDVLVEAVPVVHAAAAAVVGVLALPLALPLGPVVLDVPFDLISGGGHPEGESARKFIGAHETQSMGPAGEREVIPPLAESQQAGGKSPLR